jgi:ribosomal protein L31E
MAKEEEKKEERIFTIPLRKEFSKAPKWKRANKATIFVREYLIRHMKTTEAKLGRELNEFLWSNGGKNPPAKVTVHALVHEGIARANLTGYDIHIPEKKEKEEKKKEEPPAEVEEDKTFQRAEPTRKKSKKKPEGAKKSLVKNE